MNSIEQKILNFILECKSTSDEREKIEITEILSRCLLHTYVFIALSMIISVIVDRIYFINSIGTIFLILIFLYISGFISIELRRKSLANINIYTYEEYQNNIKIIKFIGLFNGIYFGAGMFLFMEIVYKYIQNIDVNLNFTKIVLYILLGLPFGVFSYYIQKSKLNKEY
ncbi:DUF3278 domain-containing protein [Staphylococcus aureus]